MVKAEVPAPYSDLGNVDLNSGGASGQDEQVAAKQVVGDLAPVEEPLPKDLIHLGAEDNHSLGMFHPISGGAVGQVGQVRARQPWPSLTGPHFSINEALKDQAGVEAPLLKNRAAVEPPC